MESIKKTMTHSGRVSDGKDEMLLFSDDGILRGIGSIVSRIAEPYNGKRCKISITVEIEEIN